MTFFDNIDYDHDFDPFEGLQDNSEIKENLVFITGGSKGIGLALVNTYLKADYEVISFARTEIAPMQIIKNINLPNLKQIEVDLMDMSTMPKIIERVLSSEVMAWTHRKRIVWINNAGTLGEMAALDDISISNIEETVRLNLTAPLILSKLFLQYTKDVLADKKIINISSGAATIPYHGWAVYGSTKAALDMLTKTLALEQSAHPFGAKLLGIYPGVVDTGMQSLIREQKESDFKSLNRFVELKETDQLYKPVDVALEILSYDLQDLPSGEIVRVNL
ncbi:MAG: SDR family NAD(P)-dependent oxidoreductase [Pedobacter sp.]|nr:MAG: SDR family NAD(P)-dependent oxidoreductase [Pedobacter sp.]